ncbi:MAG: flagellar biosynthetic protein FliQ [Rhodospirillales bacterium]|nr:MAG: flagellar biosynthetic protein FliQ [Rhodospirillales bacterium]
MNELAVIEVGRDALYVTLKIAAPVMLAGMAIGLVIALFQALTTIQEMTLTFVPKILVIFASIILFLPFMVTTLIEFTHGLFHLIIAPQ